MSFHISQRFIDELLEEDCPYMDLTVEALGIGREPGLLTCHPKAACVVAGVEVAARLLESSGCRVACEAASGDRLEAGQVFLRAEGSAGAIHRSLKIAQNVMEYSSGIATRAAGMLESARKANPHVQLAVTRKHFPGTKRLSLAAAQAGIGSGFRIPCWFLISIVSSRAGSTDSPPGCPSTARRFRNRSWVRKSPPRRKPSCWHARASIPSNANVLPVRILKKRYAGSRPSTPPFRCSPPEA